MLDFNSGVKRNELVTSVGKRVEVGLVSSWEHSWTEKRGGVKYAWLDKGEVNNLAYRKFKYHHRNVLLTSLNEHSTSRLF